MAARSYGHSGCSSRRALAAAATAAWLGTALFACIPSASAQITVANDWELDRVAATGAYFTLDLQLQILDPSTNPTITLNSSTATVPTTTTGAAIGGSVTLTGSAQSGLTSLVNVIGSGSVINVGINVVNIGTSTGSTINTINNNYGTLGTFTTAIP